jgi:hypothetical protein
MADQQAYQELTDRRDQLVERALRAGFRDESAGLEWRLRLNDTTIHIPNGDPTGEEFRWEEQLDHLDAIVGNHERGTWQIIGRDNEVVGSFTGTYREFDAHMQQLRAAVGVTP